MADMTISCPHCNQVITCDVGWAGQEMPCPTCRGGILVPSLESTAPRPAGAQSTLAPKPPSGGASRLSLGGHSQQPAQQNRAIPIRDLTGPAPKKKNRLVSIAVSVVVVAALGTGGYFGFKWVSERQKSLNAKREAAERNSDGGEVGHTMELYNVLDKTEPGRELGSSSDRATGPRQRRSGVGQEIPVGDEAAAGTNALPKALPATYTLDVGTAKIPEGRANGSVSGTNFLPEIVRIDPVGTSQLLRFLQGPITAPDLGLLVYLKLKPGEKLGGQTLTIASDLKSGAPTVTKLWKPNPKFAARQQNYFNGYAMKLELGQPTNNMISGKIFLALPDTEQTVVAGLFNAALPSADSSLQADQGAPATGAPQTPDRSAFERRYGIKPTR